MACAVTDFEGLCGFRPLNELAQHLEACPELRALVGAEIAQQVHAAVAADPVAQSAALKAAFSAVMGADAATIKARVCIFSCACAELVCAVFAQCNHHAGVE